LPEISRDNALWAYSIRASDQLHSLDVEKVHDPVLMHLLDMGVRDWKGLRIISSPLPGISSSTGHSCSSSFHLGGIPALTVSLIWKTG
jgi:hypothetical protein